MSRKLFINMEYFHNAQHNSRSFFLFEKDKIQISGKFLFAENPVIQE